MSIKCAEIYFSDSGNFTFTCILCSENFLKAINLADHLIDNHFFSPDALKNSFLIADDSDDELSKICEFENEKELSLEQSNSDIEKEILESNDSDIKIEKNLNGDNLKTNDVNIPKIPIKNEIIFVDVKQEENELENSNIINDDDDNISKEESIPNSKTREINKIKSKTAAKSNFLNKGNIPNSKRWKCHICNTIISKKSRTRHIRIVHEKEKLNFHCKYCDESFFTVIKLTEHTRTHTGEPERPFQCSECDNKYKILLHLNNHMKRVHLKLRNYKCNFCERTFFNNDEAKRHEIARHKQQKPYICEVCGHGSTNTQQFKNHKRRHAEPTFECNKCDKKFHVKRSLKIHQIVHEDKDYKPYECAICSTRFIRNKSYKRHMELHSGIKDYICKLCGKAFAQASGIGCHMKSHGIKYCASNVIRKSKTIDENESQ